MGIQYDILTQHMHKEQIWNPLEQIVFCLQIATNELEFYVIKMIVKSKLIW